MEAIDYFAWFVLLVIILSVVFVFVSLAQLPGKLARARSHPHADAVDMAGWLGILLTLGVIWVLAMVWAQMPSAAPEAATPTGSPAGDGD